MTFFRRIPLGAVAVSAALFTFVEDACAAPRNTPWSVAEAKAWRAREGWRVGANYLPSNAINQHEMWSAKTWDAATNARELDYARTLGFNTVRVFLHDLSYQEDPKGLLEKMDAFLGLCEKRGIKPLFVFFDDCWLDPARIPTLIPKPRAGTHNSGWLQSPGVTLTRNYPKDAAVRARLREYVQTVLKRFADDKRVLGWDLYNEPGNRANLRFDEKGNERGGEVKDGPSIEGSNALLNDVFDWAWEVNPTQPLTSGVWMWREAGKHPLPTTQLGRSDIISFHEYGNPGVTKSMVSLIKRQTGERPMVCTEYMARPLGNTFQAILPYFAVEDIGAINWGFIAGKSQTYYSWNSWKKPETEKSPWFHDILHKDGKPYDQAEYDFVRKTIAGKLAKK